MMPIHPTAFVLTTAISLVPSKKSRRKAKRGGKRKAKRETRPESEVTFRKVQPRIEVAPLAPKLAVAIEKAGIDFDCDAPRFRMPAPQQTALYCQICFAMSSDMADAAKPPVVLLRDRLGSLYPKYDWSIQSDDMDTPQLHLWRDGLELVRLAAAAMSSDEKSVKGRGKIRVGKKRYLLRPHVQDAGVDFDALSIDDVVECIAATESGEDEERIYARVTKLTGPNGEPQRFEVQIIGRLQGRDVAPRRSDVHGFSFVEGDEQQSSRMFLTRGEDSGVVRIVQDLQDEEAPVDVSNNASENRG